ncbi:MAG TPA: hypothetical protein VHX60_00935 [Acidobacteriaceae bacterium]|jgi:hypothetical protein|nr:hypothetical protein [Acidobacteriaceae bacterium]
MAILTRKDSRFGVEIGGKAPDVVLPAMPIRIHYIGVEQDYSLEGKNGECLFRVRTPKEFTPKWDFGPPWDAYKLRDAFERLQTPDDAWRLLNVIGPFRSKSGRSKQANVLTWGELKGWQDALRRLRLRDSSHWFPILGIRDAELKQAFYRSDFIAESGVFAEHIWSVSDETFWWLQGFPQGLSIRRDMYLSRDEIDAIFSAPGARVPESREWYHARAVLARRRDEHARGNPDGKQRLIAEVTPATALDAILATVYVDKLRGLDLQVCALKECNATFERQSDQRKQYCTNYHAHLASVRRNRQKAKRQREPMSQRGRGK